MHKKGHIKKTRKTKHRGGYYGAAGPIQGTVGAMQWNKGTEVAPPKYAGGKRRKSTRKTKRKMRGGNKFGAVSASFQGSGTNGMANYVPVSTKGGVAAYGAFNDNGAKPGSSFP
jgi:hypothetical protein